MPAAYQTHVLSLGKTRAEVVPERGGLVTRVTVERYELLYMDHDTLFDPSKSVRGGIPLLFPFAGTPPVDADPAAKKHGWARDVAFDAELERDDLLRMRAERAGVRLEATVRLLARGVQLDLVAENASGAPVPASPGFHPYFACPLGSKRDVRVAVPGFDPARLTEDEVFDFGIVAAPGGRARVTMPGLGDLVLEADPRMRHLQLWSLPGKPFVCVEPFWGPNGTISTPARDEIPPGEARDYWMRVELT
jgi:galactose mutarotase-like enzyme